MQFPAGVAMRPSKGLLGLHASAAWMTAQHHAPNRKIPTPSCNASDDGTAKQAITIMSINAWRDLVWKNNGSFEGSESGHQSSESEGSGFSFDWDRFRPSGENPENT